MTVTKNVKSDLIALVKKNIPIAAIWPDADSFSGVYVRSKTEVIGLGESGLDGIGLAELDLVTLAMLVEDGVRPGDPDWTQIQEYLAQSEADMKVYKQRQKEAEAEGRGG